MGKTEQQTHGVTAKISHMFSNICKGKMLSKAMKKTYCNIPVCVPDGGWVMGMFHKEVTRRLELKEDMQGRSWIIQRNLQENEVCLLMFELKGSPTERKSNAPTRFNLFLTPWSQENLFECTGKPFLPISFDLNLSKPCRCFWLLLMTSPEKYSV